MESMNEITGAIFRSVQARASNNRWALTLTKFFKNINWVYGYQRKSNVRNRKQQKQEATQRHH